MNYIKHLTGFFEKVIIDRTLNPTHISLYIALFQFWNCNRFKNPISISRDELMRISKISSKATYHKCLRNLHELGYINYQPSYNPFKGSHVIMFNFSENLKPQTKAERTPLNEPISNPSAKQVLHESVTSSQTSDEQALVSYINSSNNTNNLKIENSLNENKRAEELNNNESFKNKSEEEKEKKLREKKKYNQENLAEENRKSSPVKNHFILPGLNSVESNKWTTPTIQEVKVYCIEENFPDIEAQKFYNYYSSIGWLVGGKTPMQNWKSAVQNWMLNATKYTQESENQQPRANQLNATTTKNYAEPL